MNDRPETLNGVPVPYDASLAELSGMIGSAGPRAWAAFEALAHCDTRESLDLLAAQTRCSDPFIRRAAVEAIGKHARGAQLDGVILDGFDDASEFVVRTACDAAAALHLSAAHGSIVELLDDDAAATRHAAVRALAKVWHESDFTKVLELARGDRSETVRKEAAWTLREHASDANWRALFDAWRNAHPPRYRTWACQVAEQFGDTETLPVLAEMSNDPDGHVWKAAQRAIEVIRRRA